MKIPQFLIVLICCFYAVLPKTVFSNDMIIHGFISQGYLKSSDNNFLADTEDGTFQFNEMGINFSTSVSGQLRLGMQFFARDLGNEGNDEIVLDWAFADYMFSENIRFRAGKMKMVFNLYNDTRDADFTHISALLPQSIYQELTRDLLTSVKGCGIYGTWCKRWFGLLSYDFQFGVLQMDEESGLSKAFIDNSYKATGVSVNVEETNHDYAINGRMIWQLPFNKVPWLDFFNVGVGFFDIKGLNLKGQIVGINGIRLEQKPSYVYETNTLRSVFYSMEYAYKGLHLTYEYTNVKIKGKFVAFEAVNFFETPNDGWYLMAAYRFTDKIEMGVGYMEYFPQSNDRSGQAHIQGNRPAFLNWMYDTNATLRIDFSENWIAKLEYHYIDGFGVFSSAENDPDDLEQYWHLYVLKVTYNF